MLAAGAAGRRLCEQLNTVQLVAVGAGPERRALTIDNESGGTWACDFNPFNLSDIGFSLGNVYEPLVFVNTLQKRQDDTRGWPPATPGATATRR